METAAQTSMGHTHRKGGGGGAAEIQILQFLPFLFPVYTEHRRENATRQFQSIRYSNDPALGKERRRGKIKDDSQKHF